MRWQSTGWDTTSTGSTQFGLIGTLPLHVQGHYWKTVVTGLTVLKDIALYPPDGSARHLSIQFTAIRLSDIGA